MWVLGKLFPCYQSGSKKKEGREGGRQGGREGEREGEGRRKKLMKGWSWTYTRIFYNLIRRHLNENALLFSYFMAWGKKKYGSGYENFISNIIVVSLYLLNFF